MYKYIHRIVFNQLKFFNQLKCLQSIDCEHMLCHYFYAHFIWSKVGRGGRGDQGPGCENNCGDGDVQAVNQQESRSGRSVKEGEGSKEGGQGWN